jgi:uncharacterized membrane protein
LLRNKLMEKNVAFEPDFRLRGTEVSRTETFSDAVFAFAITLLVVSLEVPVTFEELEYELLRGFLGFAICFALLVWLWFAHYKFFRRYALQDGYTIFLNSALLFVVLFYIYPLKFLFTLLAEQFLHLSTSAAIHNDQWPALMMIYGAGFFAVYTIFALLYAHAYRERAALELNEVEVNKTTDDILSNLLLASIGVVSICIALGGGTKYVAWSGWAYAATVPVQYIADYVMKRRRQASLNRRAAPDDTQPGRPPA